MHPLVKTFVPLGLRAGIALLLLFAGRVLAAEDARPVENDAKTPAAPAVNPTLPTLFLVGDSTVRTGTRDQLGWGDPLAGYFDRTKLNVVNRAIGGRSSRTFRTEGRWEKVLAELKPGDFLLIQFGHNDGGEMFQGTRPRASIKGNGDESTEGVVEETGKTETVRSFGWYLRQYVTEAKAKGAHPIVCSLVPRKLWKDGRVIRANDSYGKWAREAAEAAGAPFLDLNEIIARRYEKEGKEAVEAYFADERTHTTPLGADVNAQCVVSGIKGLEIGTLVKAMSDKAQTVPAYDPKGTRH